MLSLWQCNNAVYFQAFSSNCIQLAVLCVNYCAKVQGSTLKILIQRCKYLRCLQLQQTNLTADNMTAVEWEKAAALQELDITATDLTQPAIIGMLQFKLTVTLTLTTFLMLTTWLNDESLFADVLTRIPGLVWLSAGQLDGMNDNVLAQVM